MLILENKAKNSDVWEMSVAHSESKPPALATLREAVSVFAVISTSTFGRRVVTGEPN